MKIGCTSFSFERLFKKQEMNLKQFINLCEKLNIEGVEFWDEHFPIFEDHFIRELSEYVESLGLKIIAIAVNNHNFTSQSLMERVADIKKVKNWIDIAVKLNADVVRILPGDLKVLNTDQVRIYPFVIKALMECLNHAKNQGIPLAIENCPRETDPWIILKLIKDLGTDHLGTCPDFGNFPAQIRYEALKKFAPYAIHVHAKSYRFDQNGEEISINYSQAIQILKNVKYNRYLSIEYEGVDNEIEGVKKTRDLIKRYID